MTIRKTTSALCLLALLGSSASMAATVTVTPSSLVVAPGQNFTITISADVPNTFAGTMDLSFDPTKVAFVQPNATGIQAGVGIAPWILIKNSPASASPTVIDVERPTTTGPNPGVYQIATLTFTVLAAGNAGIIINDDGGATSGWFDDTNFEYIPVNYTQANACLPFPGCVPPPCWPLLECPPPDVPEVPIPTTAWLFGSAVGVMGWIRRGTVRGQS